MFAWRKPIYKSERSQREGPLVMGVLNVTPDSFSDGARFTTAAAAIEQGLRLLDDGADILDIGGESTRPGSDPVPAAEEIARILPVVEGVLARRADAAISVDTMKPQVAKAAIEAGASIWNDVTALGFAPGSLETAAALSCDVVLMHMQGAPKTMQADPRYDDVVGEVIDFLRSRAEAAEAAGVEADRICVDPGIGFGKTLAHNLALMAALSRIAAETGKPLLFGASRKRFIEALDPTATDPMDRLGGSLAAALAAARAGAAIVRVHDVRETVQALTVQAAIAEAGE